MLLHVVINGSESRHYKFQKRAITIGQAFGNDIVINEPGAALARHQCRISVEGARVFVTDLKTSQATLVNGKMLSVPTPLRPFDILSFYTSRTSQPIRIQAYLDEEEADHSISAQDRYEVQVNKNFALRKKNVLLQRWVASSPDVPSEIVEELSGSFDLETLRCIAMNPNARPALLSKLAPCCAKEIVKNPSFFLWLLEDSTLGQFSVDALSHLLVEDVPITLLSHLASHPSDQIRCVIAKHPEATKEILAQIPIEEGTFVLSPLLRHPNCPMERLLELARHGTEIQREVLANSYALPGSLIDVLCEDESEEVRYWLSDRKTLTEKAQDVLSQDVLRIRSRVAKNVSFFAPILDGLWERFARDPEESIRLSLLELFEVPEGVILMLCEDASLVVRERAKLRAHSLAGS